MSLEICDDSEYYMNSDKLKYLENYVLSCTAACRNEYLFGET